MSYHLPYSASSTARWLACPSSVKAAKDLPDYDDSNEYSEAGTDLHALAALALVSNAHTHADPTVRMYVEYVAHLRATYTMQLEAVEQLVRHADYPDLGGTPDYASLYEDHEGRTCLHVVDFKSGIGTIVDVDGNEQLLTYAACIASSIPFVDIDVFRLTIVQPQSYRDGDEISTIDVAPSDVAAHMLLVTTAIQQDHFATGSHCRYCPIRATCITLSDDMVRTTQLDSSDPTPTPATLTKWLHLLSLQSVINKTLDQIEDRLVQLHRDGTPLPNAKVVESRGHRFWSADSVKVIRWLGKLGLRKRDVMSTPKLLSPSQIESLPIEGMTKKEIKEKLLPLVDQKVSGFKVVPLAASGKPVEFGSEFSDF